MPPAPCLTLLHPIPASVREEAQTHAEHVKQLKTRLAMVNSEAVKVQSLMASIVNTSSSHNI